MFIGIPSTSRRNPLRPSVSALTYPPLGLLCHTATGSAGLLNTISAFSGGHILSGVFGAIVSAGWGFQAFGGALLYQRVYAFKNGHEGLTFADVSGPAQWREAGCQERGGGSADAATGHGDRRKTSSSGRASRRSCCTSRVSKARAGARTGARVCGGRRRFPHRPEADVGEGEMVSLSMRL